VAIFNKAKEARSTVQSSDEARRRTIGVFRALISLDSNHHYHRNHGELGYVLHDTGLDLKESEEEITKAIDIRDRRGLTGWLYYEFKRALVRIKQDKERPSKPDVKEAVLKDLRKVYGDPKRRKDIEENPQIQEWLEDNSLSNNDLEKRKPEV
jgi:hypothetical protein